MAGATTKIAIDVHYEDNAAYAAGVLFEHWSDSSPAQTVRCERYGLADYEPLGRRLRAAHPRGGEHPGEEDAPGGLL